jgi:CheY-like chemotaxis protein
MPDGGILNIKTAEGFMGQDHITSHRYGKVGHYAIITVSDSGRGMDEHTRQHLFDPFFTTKEVGKGTGLGMSMVMGIVKQHAGFVDVQSDIGIGTVITIFLPLLTAGETTDDKPNMDVLPDSGRATILVAEDEPAVRDFMEQLLTMHGYTIILANDGHDAVEKFNAHKNDVQLVILDMVMPKMNGKAVLDEIYGMGSAIPAIFISGYASDIIQQQGDIGSDSELLMKPIQPMMLLTKIKTMLTHT